jgi:hypothetical protein
MTQELNREELSRLQGGAMPQGAARMPSASSHAEPMQGQPVMMPPR